MLAIGTTLSNSNTSTRQAVGFLSESSIKFDGTDDAVDTGFQPDFIHTNATMAYWVNMDDLSGAQLCGTHNGKRFYLGFYNATAGMGVQDQNNLGSGADLSSLIAVNQWHHIAMVADGGTATFYLDGVARDTMSYTQNSANNPNANLYIGAKSNSGTYDDFINGSVDEFAVFSSALTAREVDELYNNGQPTNLSSYSTLEAWYRMGEGKLGTNSDGDENLLFDQGPNGNALGSELVTNGTFTSDASGWSADYSVALSSDSGRLKMVNATTVGIARQTVTVVVGKVYEVSVDMICSAGDSPDLRVLLGTSVYGTQYYSSGTVTSDTTVKRLITATSTALHVDVRNNGSAGTAAYFDNISVKEVQNVGTISGAEIQADGGTELVTNGTFDTDLSGWTTTTATWVSGAANLPNGVEEVALSKNGVTTLDSTFKISWDQTINSGTRSRVRIRNGAGNSDVDFNYYYGSGPKSVTVTSVGVSVWFYSQVSDNITIDNVSVKEVTKSVPKKTVNLPSAGSAKSLSFDGTDDFAIVPYQLPTTTFTVSVWFKITEDALTSASTYIWDARDASNTTANIFLPVKHSATEYKLRWWNDGTHRINNATIYPIGRWQHVVLVKDGTTGTMYVDGVKLDSATSFSNTTNGTEINLGRRYAATFAYLKGGIDEFAAWDTVLDGDAIKALYNAGLPTPVTTKTGAYDIYRDNLKAYYRMGDATNPAADGASARLSNSFGSLLFDQTSPGVGAEVITNGTFDSDVSSWGTSSGGTVTFSNGTAITGAVGTDDRGGMSQTFTTVNGATYQLTFDVISRTSTKWEVYRQGTGAGTIIEGTDLGSHSFFFVAAATSTELAFYAKQAGTSDGTVAWDNISVKQVKGHSGTISGASVVDNNVPRQIYALPPLTPNAKSVILDGTNDHLVTQVDDTLPPNGESRYYSFWCKASDTSATAKQAIFGHGGSGKGAFFFNYASSRPLLIFSGSVFQYWVDNSAQDDGNWHHWVVKIVANDLTGCELWCDGVKLAKDSAINSGSMTPYSSGITIGTNLEGNYLEGSIEEFSIHEDLGSNPDEAIRALFNRGRPIDISKSQGAYDVSDKALHWWRMGDSNFGAYADGTNDIIFEGLEAEDSEEVTNGDFSNGTTGWTISNTGGQTVEVAANSAGSNALHIVSDGTLVTATQTLTTVGGRVYRLQYDLELVSGEMKDSFEAAVTRSKSGTYTRYFTATDSSTFVQFKRSTASEFFIDNVSVKQVRGQYKDASIVSSDAYHFSKWTMYGDNVFSNPSPNVARVTRVDTVTGDQGAYAKTQNNNLLTENQVVGQVYCITFDFETNDSNARARFWPGSGGYYMFPVGSGSYTYTYVALNTYGVLSADSLDVGKYAQWSNIKVQKLIGPAVMTNMTADIQTDTPY